MKKINLLLILSLFVLGISACKQQERPAETLRLTSAGADATAPYFTKDNNGNPVICWAEKSADDSLYQLKYAVYNGENAFEAPLTVPVSAGLSTSPESMGKVAFKSDNTVIAVFAKSFASEKNPFAGAIYYASSADRGKSWSEPMFLHSDTSHSYGRSFFDITRLKNGEVAAIWLDGRFGKAIKGSGLFYATTGKDQKFGRDTCLYKGTCECCRTDILQDDAGNIHVAYRSILFPPSAMGRQVRDMVYSFSGDNGRSFTSPEVISKDNWAIEGCPHTGPSLAINKTGIHAVWFTAGGSSGIYHTVAPTAKAAFQNRRMLSPAGKHPQMVALKNGSLAMVCEETAAAEPAQAKAHNMSAMNMHHQETGSSKIILQLLNDKGGEGKRVEITDGGYTDHHAVLTELPGRLLISWVREENGHSAVYYSVRRYDL